MWGDEEGCCVAINCRGAVNFVHLPYMLYTLCTIVSNHGIQSLGTQVDRVKGND